MSESAEVPKLREAASGPVACQRPSLAAQLVLAMAILLCGMVIGAGGTVVLGRRAFLAPTSGRPEQVSSAVARHMARRLNLTSQQQRQVRDIVREHTQRLTRIREQAREEAQKELDLLEEDVARVLTAEQARLWREEFARMRRLAPAPFPRRFEPRESGGRPDKAGPRSRRTPR